MTPNDLKWLQMSVYVSKKNLSYTDESSKDKTRVCGYDTINMQRSMSKRSDLQMIFQ